MLKNRELSGGSCQLLTVTVKKEYFKPSTMHKFSIKGNVCLPFRRKV